MNTRVNNALLTLRNSRTSYGSDVKGNPGSSMKPHKSVSTSNTVCPDCRYEFGMPTKGFPSPRTLEKASYLDQTTRRKHRTGQRRAKLRHAAREFVCRVIAARSPHLSVGFGTD